MRETEDYYWLYYIAGALFPPSLLEEGASEREPSARTQGLSFLLSH
jgi:hypothetical protein